MKTGILIFFILFFHYCCGNKEGVIEEPKFIFAHPKSLREDENTKVCILLKDVIGLPAKLSINLKIANQSHISTHDLESEQSCFNINVPKLDRNVKEELTNYWWHQNRGTIQKAFFEIQLLPDGAIHSTPNNDPIYVFEAKNETFVETDRGQYKPGDTVKIRILILTDELQPAKNYIIPEIKIKNPNGITIKRLENISTELGLLQIEHQLSQDTAMGHWIIEVNGNVKQFEVKEYVLPRFSVDVKGPSTVYNKAKITTISACAKYSYGQNVKGTAKLNVLYGWQREDLFNKTEELINGCAKFHLFNEELRLDNRTYGNLVFQVVVVEQGTNQEESASSTSYITDRPYNIQFSTNEFFFPGLPYHGQIKITDKHIELKNEVIQMCYDISVSGKSWPSENINQCKNLTFNNEDYIDFTIPPLVDTTTLVRLNAKALNQSSVPSWWTGTERYYPITGYSSLRTSSSPSNSYIYVKRNNENNSKCNTEEQFTVYYSFDDMTEDKNVDFYFMVKFHEKLYNFEKLAKTPKRQQSKTKLENIIGELHHNYTKNEILFDQFTFDLKLDNEIIADAKLIVYYIRSDGETVAATSDIRVEKCAPLKVTAIWSDKQQQPGKAVSMNIKAAPNSLCALTAVDKSTRFLGNSQPLDLNTILNSYIGNRVPYYYYYNYNKLNCIPDPEEKRNQNLTERDCFHGRRTYGTNDAYEIFEQFGVAYLTNLKLITKQCECEYQFHPSTAVPAAGPPGRPVMAVAAFDSAERVETFNKVGAAPTPTDVTVRSFFPETWLWELIPVSGETTFETTLPDTITNWIGSVLCVSPTHGVGISPEGEITAFQPFFVEVLTPYSIKRDETLYLKVAVFNYLNQTLPVRVSMLETNAITLTLKTDKQEIQCIKGGDSQVTIFPIKSNKLGRQNLTITADVNIVDAEHCNSDIKIQKRDTVIKSLLVEPQGYPVEETKAGILCTDGTLNKTTLTWKLKLPADVVPDSEKAKLTFSVDILGSAVENLENLIRVPTGCGEQTMSTLTPNLYVLRYLNSTNQLTDQLRKRIVKNLETGYERILNYAHDDGSFSAFGKSDVNGSMFLTSFVIRTLQQAKDYIYIDDKVIDKAVEWIAKHQFDNGCFDAVKHLFHEMGESSTGNGSVALTSYVLISLLESGINISDEVKIKAQDCVTGYNLEDKYTLAISTYAKALMDLKKEATVSLKKLLELATKEGDRMWWDKGSKATNIEMTGYALISLLNQKNPENIDFAGQVVNWLRTQSNSYGGFYSTQDTVVALDALSRYATLLSKDKTDLKAQVKEGDKDHEVSVNSDQRLQTQEVILNHVPTDVDIKVTGHGCTFVQASLRYNVFFKAVTDAFTLDITVEPVSTDDKCTLLKLSPCVSYTGPGSHSNMAVLELALPSGYSADYFSLYQATHDKVKKFETSKNKVIFYFTELTKAQICVPFNIQETAVVVPRLDSTVKIYDYYHSELEVSKTYKVGSCEPNVVLPEKQ